MKSPCLAPPASDPKALHAPGCYQKQQSHLPAIRGGQQGSVIPTEADHPEAAQETQESQRQPDPQPCRGEERVGDDTSQANSPNT